MMYWIKIEYNKIIELENNENLNKTSEKYVGTYEMRCSIFFEILIISKNVIYDCFFILKKKVKSGFNKCTKHCVMFHNF